MFNSRKPSGVQVFISYRRENGRDVARNIYERLSLLGFATFFDYDSMRNGKFNDQIYKAIDQADDFVLILSKNALDRCNNEGDWVRTEIEYALNKKRNIVLLATEDFINFPKDMPDSIASLRLINFITLRQDYYEQSIAKLKDSLKSKPAIHHWKTMAIVIGFGICAMAGWHWLPLKPENPLDGYSAVIHLMRYSNIGLLYGAEYSDSLINEFAYEDSIDKDGNTHVFPTSKYVAYQAEKETTVLSLSCDSNFNLPYHDPVIQLKLHSKTSKTLVLADAVLEVDNFSEDYGPAFQFQYDGKTLYVTNRSAAKFSQAELLYSFVRQGESFISYENSVTLSAENNKGQIMLSSNYEPDSLMGILIAEDDSRYPFCWRQYSVDRPAQGLEYFQNIPVLNIARKKKQTIHIGNFYRSLVKGEVDEEIHFRLHCAISSIFRIRLHMTTATGEDMYSNYLLIRYVNGSIG